MIEPTETEKVRVARVYLDTRYDQGSQRCREQIELEAFMSIFHPGHERIILDEEPV